MQPTRRMTPAHQSRVLGFKPCSQGFAWVAFDTPFSIYDWGQVETRSRKNARCLAALEPILDRVNPELIVLETFEGPTARQSPRVKRLYRSVVDLARGRGMDAVWLSRGDVRAAFAPVGATNRHEIASAVARSIEPLRKLLPAKRRAWECEPRRMAIFDAAAVVLAHYQLSASQLFDDLQARSPDGRES